VEADEDMTVMAARTLSRKKIRARFFLALFAALAALVLAPAGRAQESIVQLDPAQTKIGFTLSDVLHTVHGTFKLKSGAVRFDPSTGTMSGAIMVDATSGESGNGGRDRKMHREILESGKYPEIIFTPAQVKGTLAPQGPSRVEVSGQFRLHGQDHEVTLPMDIKASNGQLQMAAHITIPYVKWGVKNPSTFILRVSDKVEIDIHAVGLLAGSEASR
jgi:polyisoprenoid-binding protein YceI